MIDRSTVASPYEIRAFGMDVRTGFAMPGVAGGTPARDGRSLSLRLGSRTEVEHEFPADAERIRELRFDDGGLAVSVESGGEHGYVSYAFDFGQARIAADGRDVVIARADEPDWVWQRYLTGQVLPFAAVLQGLEVFHASVLGLEDRAIALVAGSGTGKTTLALRLVLTGLEFLSDDVLVVEPDEDGLLAHPGIGLANVRPGARGLLPELERRGLAAPIGVSDRETRISIRPAERSLPLTTLFMLNRVDEACGLRVERLSPVEPRILLAATFNLAVRTPERLARQLDVCSRLERSVSVFRLTCGDDIGPEEAADALLERAGDPLVC